jgi:PqqD family protein of HPr-rel-A system
MTGEPFIRRELRPDLLAFIERTPPPDVDASPDELRRIAETVVGETRRTWLGLDDDAGVFAGGVRISRSPDVETSEVDGESVLLDLASGDYFGLNRVGTVVWELLAEPRAIDTIAAALEERYDVDRAKATEDIARMLARMRDRGLVRAGP